MVRVSSVPVPDYLRKRIKVVCAINDFTMKEFIYGAIEDRLQKFEKK